MGRTIKIGEIKGLKQRWYEKIPIVSVEESALLNFVLEASKTTENFNSIIIGGRKGKGKSTLALWLAYYVYGDWNKVLENLHFMPEEIESKLREARKKKDFIPTLVWDDAAAFLRFIPRTYFSEAMERLKSIYETIRTSCPLIIFTAASPKRLAPFVRDDPTVVVRVFSKGYAIVFLIEEGVNFRKVFDDPQFKDPIETVKFGRVPHEIYSQYKEMRDRAHDMFLEASEKYEKGIFVTPSEFAHVFLLHPETVRLWIRRGILKESVVKVLGSYRLDLEKALEELEAKGSEGLKKRVEQVREILAIKRSKN